MRSAKDRLVFALDMPSLVDATRYMDLLRGHVGMFKVGLELFTACGVSLLLTSDDSILLDLKLHDIPETVERAVTVAGSLGVKFLTLHVQQRETMRRAARAADKTGMQLLAVTVLTSMTDEDLQDVNADGSGADIANTVRARAKLAWSEGIRGFVASGWDAATLRESYPDAVLVVPGVRPEGDDPGDQRRVTTPRQAVEQGANYVVVGRPIRDAPDPLAKADAIVRSMMAV